MLELYEEVVREQNTISRGGTRLKVSSVTWDRDVAENRKALEAFGTRKQIYIYIYHNKTHYISGSPRTASASVLEVAVPAAALVLLTFSLVFTSLRYEPKVMLYPLFFQQQKQDETLLVNTWLSRRRASVETSVEIQTKYTWRHGEGLFAFFLYILLVMSQKKNRTSTLVSALTSALTSAPVPLASTPASVLGVPALSAILLRPSREILMSSRR